MSYGVGEALQSAVYQTLVADATLAGLVGTEIYDAAPAGVLAGTYVSLGPEEARDRSAMTSAGAVHEFTVSVISDGGGTKLGHFSIIAGEALGEDLHAEVELLRAELDMLKRAFRRHCLETM